MARVRLDHMDSEIVELLDGTRLAEKVGQTFELMTVDGDGTPHAALLSAGEVLAVDDRSLRLALWSTSTTTGNLRRNGRGLLTLVSDRTFYAVSFGARPAADLAVDGKTLARFEAVVDVVHRDEVDYAEVTSGITFRLPEAEAVVNRWERTIAALSE